MKQDARCRFASTARQSGIVSRMNTTMDRPLTDCCLALLLFWCLAMPCRAASAGAAPTLDEIGTSARIPSVGRPVTYTVRLRAPADRSLAGDFRLSLEIADRPAAEKTVHLKLAAAEQQDVALQWTPQADGWHRLAFRVRSTSAPTPCAQIEQDVPVTHRPLVFLWFGAPRDFKWCTVPTTVKPEDRDWWLWRGAVPCAWKGGVCYKEWSVAQFTRSYTDSPWIAIDEVGAYDETGRKIIAAVRAHQQSHPAGCRVLWSMGVHDYWREVRDAVDLFVPEIYLNYSGDHLGRIDEYVGRARRVGCLDRTIPGLGINVVKDRENRPTVAPTREDVLRQVRHLKTIAPELPGVGFFTANAAPGVAEYADQLCGEYYVNPVLTLVPGSLRRRLTGETLELSGILRNCGGMTARAISVEFGQGCGSQFQMVTEKAVAALAPGGEAAVTASLPLVAGAHAYGLRIAAPRDLALLNGNLWTMAARGLPPEACVVYQPLTETPAGGLPLFAEAPPGAEISAARGLGAGGRAAEAVAATVLPGLPGDEAGVVTWTPESLPQDQPIAFELSSGPAQKTGVLETARSGDLLTVTGSGYVATLDLAKDQIRSLKVRAGGPELLGSPWAFSCTGCAGTQPAELKETPGGLLVTIPFSNPQAEGFSRYFCYAAAAVIRIERFFQPRAEMRVTASAEGCRMPQRGGVYALQPGVGGPVRRGTLRDSSDYSDLLFGYLGSGPGPGNARLAGWFDCAFTREGGGGLGVAIERRWEAAHSDVGYDVTRYYDGADRLSVLNLWGKALTVSAPQTQIVYLLPHGPLALDEPAVAGPAQRLWNHLQTPARLTRDRGE